jgi:hypothetical protein
MEFVRLGAYMADAEIPRTIRLPAKLWNAIDRDAVRCKRSSVKQVETLLTNYYKLENTEISLELLDKVRISQAPIEGEISDELQRSAAKPKATPRKRKASKAAR